jgi:hypothetical protein
VSSIAGFVSRCSAAVQWAVSLFCCCPVGSVTILLLSSGQCHCSAAVQWAASLFCCCPVDSVTVLLLSSGQCHCSAAVQWAVSLFCCCPVDSITVLFVSHTARAADNCCNPLVICMTLTRILKAAATIRQQPGTFERTRQSLPQCCQPCIKSGSRTFEHLL